LEFDKEYRLATAIVPKSKFRENANVSVGYGEVPAIIIESVHGSVQGWGLAGGSVTFSEQEAIAYATKLDRQIRAIMKNPYQLISAA
jgi:hypothetical protein